MGVFGRAILSSVCRVSRFYIQFFLANAPSVANGLKRETIKMENACKDDNPESSPTGVFELLGEPAVVINGVPPIFLSDGTLFLCETVSDIESHRNTSFSECLVGREVQKLFGDQFYNGKVTEFDKETGWYWVMYEDGDFEDLEWHELQEVLLPLDITVPLKTLALKVIKKRQKRMKKSVRSLSRSINHRAKKVGIQEKRMAKFNSSLNTGENMQHHKVQEQPLCERKAGAQNTEIAQV